MKRVLLLFLLLTGSGHLWAQSDSNLVISYSFDQHDFNEAENRCQPRPVGVSLVKDRFGNERSALYLHGHANSYLNLGSCDLLKPQKGTISLWVNFERIIFAGKGYPSNPVIETKNSANVDFYDAWTLYYDIDTKRIMVISTKDSTEAAVVNSLDTATFNKWQHLVFTFNDKHISLYINNVLQERSIKNFNTVYLQGDSVVVGNTANKKNDHCMRGMVDDIKIFHRVLTENEIKQLYEAPNPNKKKVFISWLSKAGIILLAVITCSYALVWRRRRALQKEKEKFEVMNRFHELEIRTLKAQMNPHFIFNSLNSIRQFIMLNENDKAEIYLNKFSKLIRQLLESNVNEHLSLSDEIDLLKGYIEMEAIRFQKQFEYVIRVDEKADTANIFIPHMIIQPFVENAIWHGLLKKADDRRLELSFTILDETTIQCIIEDNGTGREANKNRVDTFKKKSLALSYVSQRLELMSKILGAHYSVEIVDKKKDDGSAAGTKVILRLPIIKPKDHAKSNHH